MGQEIGNQPPPGYPSKDHPRYDPTEQSCCSFCKRRKKAGRNKRKGDRGFIEGCLFALCCCWLCEECCFFY